MNYYAGLDVSLRTVNICIIDDQGGFIAETKLDSEVTDIVAYLDSLDLEFSCIGLEAGTLTQYLTYGLQSAGFEVVCMEARQVKAALSACVTKPTRTMPGACLRCSVSSCHPSWGMVLSMLRCVTSSRPMW